MKCKMEIDEGYDIQNFRMLVHKKRKELFPDHQKTAEEITSEKNTLIPIIDIALHLRWSVSGIKYHEIKGNIPRFKRIKGRIFYERKDAETVIQFFKRRIK